MSLQSFGFFGFLLVVAAVYLHLPQRRQSAFLLAASWVFYALAMPSMLPVTIAIAVFTYLCGRGMAARDGAHKTAFLRIGVVGLLAILAFFKYNGAFASDGGWQAVAMPLGISFYSFAAISYLIDAARGDCEVEKNFIDCALFLNFFATVTQGPICRAGALLPQFKKEHRFDAARTVRALRLMALGLFKLVAVSDVLGLLVDEVFPNYHSYGGPMLVLAAVFYTFQLYFNFSGYSEVARAVGLLLGLELPENFKTPFFATNFSGFWSRWHISFSSWLQDYLFMPLAWADVSGLTGGKISRLPAEFCVFTVFFVSGFWHGNTLPFVVWGLLQASYRLGEELLHRRLGKPKKKAPARVLWAKRAGVFVLWCVSMVFFRVGSSPAAAPLTVAMDTLRGTPDTIESGDWAEADYLADDGTVLPLHRKLYDYTATITPRCKSWALNDEQFNRLHALARRCQSEGVRLIVVLPPMADNVRTEVCDVFGITEAMQGTVLPTLAAWADECGVTLLDYEWGGSVITDDDKQFFDGFHLDERYGLPEWTEELVGDIVG